MNLNLHSYFDLSRFASGGDWEPTQANFPNCAHFFKYNEATSVSDFTLSDSLTSLVLSSPTATQRTNNGDGTLSFDAGITAIDAGVWTPPLTKNILLMWSGKPASTGGNIVIGGVATSASRGFRSSANGSGTTTPAVVGEGAAAVITGTAGLSGTVLQDQAQARALTIDWGSATGIAPYDYDGTTWTARAAAGDLSTVPQTGITTMDAAVNINVTVRPAYIQIWYFDTLPTAAKIKSALLWTHYMAMTAVDGEYHKLLFPGFKT